MGTVKATLVGVSNYDNPQTPDLSACKNDIVELKNALIKGLCVLPTNIRTLGNSGKVSIKELAVELQIASLIAEPDDTYIFYFSGHGNNGTLALSETNIRVQEVIELVDNIKARNKIIILDSCRSGDFMIPKVETPGIDEMVDAFVGAGYAVMASCGANENSTFYPGNRISLYTSFLCNALTTDFIIKKGQKSLEEINELISRMSELWNQRGYRIQHPIFRSNIAGTIYFPVQKYSPYQKQNIYKENEEYIIYEVSSFHQSMQKRYTAKIILKYQFEENDIVRIAKEVIDEIRYADVYINETQELKFKGLPANMIRCHMGNDEQDMIDGNFEWITVWGDDTMDKNNWYRESKNSKIIDGILVDKQTSYNMLRTLNQQTVTPEEYIQEARKDLNEIVAYANQFISKYREYANGIFSENELVNEVKGLNSKIASLYLKISDLPKAPLKCNSWAESIQQVAATIHDFTLYYGQRTMNTWSKENRIELMKIAIKRYQQEIEFIKREEKLLIENE